MHGKTISTIFSEWSKRIRDFPTSRYWDVPDLCGDILDSYDKLTAAEDEVDSGAIGGNFLPPAGLLRANIRGQEGDFYTVVKSFFAAPFGTPNAEIAILNMVRFTNIRTHQMRNATMDRSGTRDAKAAPHNSAAKFTQCAADDIVRCCLKYAAQSYNLGMSVKINGK